MLLCYQRKINNCQTSNFLCLYQTLIRTLQRNINSSTLLLSLYHEENALFCCFEWEEVFEQDGDHWEEIVTSEHDNRWLIDGSFLTFQTDLIVTISTGLMIKCQNQLTEHYWNIKLLHILAANPLKYSSAWTIFKRLEFIGEATMYKSWNWLPSYSWNQHDLLLDSIVTAQCNTV